MSIKHHQPSSSILQQYLSLDRIVGGGWRMVHELLTPSVARMEEAPSGPSLGGAAAPSALGESSSSSLFADSKRTATANDKNKNEFTWTGFAVELTITIGIGLISSYFLSILTRNFMKDALPGDASDPETPKRIVYRRLHKILRKRGASHNASKPELPHLSPRELQMADEIIDPDDIECSFADIGGLDATKQEIYELAVLPLVQPDLFGDSKLVEPVKGMLLYGKPGTGKTMLAKALAKESEAIFLPLQLSKILNKYWGESNKLIASTFSLAHKLQPAIIFIDELDTFLKNTNSETAYMDSIKAEFLTLWDGVATSGSSRVLVLGATNKPQNIDSAILRRMPRAFEVPLPNDDGRLAILELLLKDERVEPRARAALPTLAKATQGYSGSDLKELCKAAAMVPVQERTAEFARMRVMGEANATRNMLDTKTKLRPIAEHDLLMGLKKVRRTGEAAFKYGKQSEQDQQEQEQQSRNNIDVNSLQHIATLLRSLSALSVDNDTGDEIPNIR